MKSLKGRVAFVSGGARGIGAATAEALAGAGAAVMLGDVLGEGEETAARLVAAGGDVRFRRLDVTAEEQWHPALGACEASSAGSRSS